MKKINVNFLQMFLVIGIFVVSITTVALVSTIIDSNGITTDNVIGANSSMSLINNVTNDGTYSFNVDGDSLFNGAGYFRSLVLVNNSLVDEEATLKIDGTYATTTSAALMQIVGTASRMMFVSGESSWPTTWSMGINTSLSLNPNQDFQIREVADGTGVVDLPRLTILKSNGDVGIGTSTPESTLQVYGGDTATSTVQIGGLSSNKGGCIKIQDSDGAGYSYVTFLRGVMKATTTQCN